MARRRISSKALENMSGWSDKDRELSGLPDPLNPYNNPSDEIVTLWEQKFYEAIANDHEYWQSRSQQGEQKQYTPSIDMPDGPDWTIARAIYQPDTIDIILARAELAAVLIPRIIATSIITIIRRIRS